MLKPLQNISHTITQPLFPALSEIQHDDERAASVYVKVVMVISLITFPMMLGLLAVAGDFVLVVFGEKWLPAVPILQVLCVVGAMQSIGGTVGDIYQAKGRTDIMLRVGIIGAALMCVSFLVGVRWGAIGVAVGYALATAVFWIYSHARANALIKLRNGPFWKSLVPAARMSVIMMLLVWLAGAILGRLDGLGSAWTLVLLVCTGVVVYTLLLCLSRDARVTEVRRIVLRETRGLFAPGSSKS
jgi:PST family polysaccharide transporter